MARLTDKQKRFVAEYLVDMNATAASIRAGYKNPDSGRQLIAKSHVAAAIAEAQNERSRRTNITADRVLNEIAKVAFDEGDDGQNSRLRYVNKLRALELLGKHLGLFERERQGGDDDGREQTGVVVMAPVMEPMTPPQEDGDG